MLSITCKRAIRCLAFVGLTVFGAARADAGFTTVKSYPQGDELGHAAILSSTYGGAFASSGLNLSNGSITATRLEDFGHPAHDQNWSGLGGNLSVRAIARFAGYEQSLGMVGGTSGGVGSPTELFSVVGFGLNVTGSADVSANGGAFRFTRGGGGELASSLNADNVADHDQLVTYRLTGPDGLDRYLLFFEDTTADQNSDWDFNDLVVELSGASVAVVPLPPAVWSGLTVLLTGGLLTARGRVMRWFR